ncbi:MAG TPA: hypothetical protein VL334_23215, partial [Anaerolineae bacterium]|nr:hypothetical protein [Anaerolineae bacterium]
GPDSWFVRLQLPVALLVVFAALILLLILRVAAARPGLSWTWQPLTVAGGMLEWRLDGWNWLTAVLILLLAAVAALLGGSDVEGAGASSLTRPDRSESRLEQTLWLASAALVFTASGNVVTLASSWILFDVVLTWRLRPGEQAEPAARAWSLLSITAILLLLVLALLGEGGIKAPLVGRSFDRWELGLLWLAALVRAGVYPLHFWLIGTGHLDRAGRLILGVLAPLLGLWLLARLQAGALREWLNRPEWAALGALALLGSALVAWTETDDERRWRWIAINRASLVVLAAYLAGSAVPEALVWSVVTFSLGCALLMVGQTVRTQLGWRLPVWLAVLVLWGLPGTAGFLARWAVVYPTDVPLAIPLFGLILLAETLLMAALWRAARGREAQVASQSVPEPGRPQADSSLPEGRIVSNWSIVAGSALAVALLALPLVVWGLYPRGLARLTGWPPTEIFPALGAALTQARKSVWIGLALSAGLGVLLGIYRRRIFDGMLGWQRGITEIVSLEWLYRAITLGLGALASALQYFARLGEGEGYLGWLALGVLLLWVLLRG